MMTLLLGLVDEHDIGCGTVVVTPHPYFQGRVEQYVSGVVDELVGLRIRVHLAALDTPGTWSTRRIPGDHLEIVSR